MTNLVLIAALKGTVLLAAAWAATTFLRNSSADLRHRVWLAALFGLVLLTMPVRVPEAAQVNVVYTFTANASSSAVTESTPLWPTIWAAGAMLMLVRFLVGAVQLARLTRASRATEDSGVRISGSISTPLTWGVFKPSILLPAYAAGWSQEKTAIALAHERAHIARGDWFWQSFAQIVNALFWFHPLVWLASARIRTEAEQAVDDAVLSTGAEASSYAQQLLEVARHMSGPTQSGAVAMVRYPALSTRIAAILDATRIRKCAGVRSRIAIAVAVLCSAPLLAAFQASPLSQLPNPPAPAVRNPEQFPVQQAKLVPRVSPRAAFQAKSRSAPATQSEPYPIGDGVSAPVPVHRVDPEYSLEARDAKHQGEVVISVVIGEDGVPQELTVVKPLGLGLDEKAMEAVHQWRFRPGLKDGLPVSVRATIAVQFHLL